MNNNKATSVLKSFDTTALLDDPIVRGLFICLPNEDCTTEFINKAMLHILDCKTELEFREYSEGKIHNIIHTDDAEKVEKTVFSTPMGEVFEVTYRIRTKLGNYKWVLKKGRLIENEVGKQALVCVCTEITEIVQLQEELLAQKEEMKRRNIELNTLVENVPGGVYRCNLIDNTSIDYVSNGLCQLLGYTLEEINSKFKQDYTLLIHPEDRNAFRQLAKELSQKEDKKTIEYRLCTKEGATVWVFDTINSIKMEDNRMLGFALVANIDKSKRENIKLQTLMDTLPGAVIQYKYDVEKGIQIEYFNAGTCNLLGYSYEELENKTNESLLEEIYEEDKEIVLNVFSQLINSNESVDCSYRIHAKNKLIWVRMISKTAYKEKGSLNIISTLFDITEEMEAKNQRQWEQQRYQLLMEGANTLTFDYNPRTDKMYYRGQDITKEYMEEEVPNFTENMKIFVKEDQLELTRSILKEICEKPQRGSLDLHLLENDGSYNWYRAKYVSIKDDGGNMYRVIGRLDDINEEKLEELELKEKLGKDLLTNLFNRVKFEEIANKKLQKAKELEEGLIFILLDIDNFKAVNDNYGHLIGDKLLQSFAEVLQSLFRKDDVIARLGGDEMAIIIPKNIDRATLQSKMVGIFDKMRRLEVDGKEMPTKCSIGIAMFPNHADNFEELYHHADVALYQAKRAGKNQYCIYNENSTSPSVGAWVDKEWLLDTMNTLIYISDTTTYELIYMSKAMCDKFEIYNYRNRKCYEVLQGRNEPCEMCTNHLLSFDKFYCWEYLNPKFKVKAFLKDKLIHWGGKVARMEVITELE